MHLNTHVTLVTGITPALTCDVQLVTLVALTRTCAVQIVTTVPFCTYTCGVPLVTRTCDVQIVTLITLHTPVMSILVHLLHLSHL